jgi:hypothetical protein
VKKVSKLTQTKPKTWEDEVEDILKLVDKTEGCLPHAKNTKQNLLWFRQKVMQSIETKKEESELNVCNSNQTKK